MNKQKIHEMPNFEYSPKGFAELKDELKTGKIIRNPFAKFYGEKVEVIITQDKKTDTSSSQV